MKHSLTLRLAAIASCSAAAHSPTAEAAIVFSGLVNITVPRNIDGLYMNVVTGQTSSSSFSGYDFNIYFNPNAGASNGLNFFTSAAAGSPDSRGYVALSPTGSARSLPVGYIIGPGDTYNTGNSPSASQFPSPGFHGFGFRFFNELTQAVHYGYGTINPYPSGAGDAVLVLFAYESTPGVGIQYLFPAPGPVTAFALAGIALSRRRRPACTQRSAVR